MPNRSNFVGHIKDRLAKLSVHELITLLVDVTDDDEQDLILDALSHREGALDPEDEEERYFNGGKTPE